MQGVTNKILRVNLTSGNISVEEPEEGFYRMYLGGAGFVSYFLLNETEQGVDPMSPDNLMVFAVGPVTGTPMPGGSRICIGAKSPLTGGIAKSELGGYAGYELKRAGFDALIVEGRSESPTYIWIHNGEVEIRDASSHWGKPVDEAHDAIEAEVGERLVRSMIIGPGGENLSQIACVIGDLRNAAGRGGLGAVMGSKNLKAVMIKGRTMPSMSDQKAYLELAKWMNNNYMGVGGRDFHDTGTGNDAAMVGGNEIGNLPVRNWGDGYFEEVKKITATTVRDTVRVDMEACPACQVRCRKVVELENDRFSVDRRGGGPEYETLAAFGSFCGVDDLDAICKANELCNFYSLDTISAGATVAFAMECFENEIFNIEDTGGVELRFGNADAMLKAIEMIAKREGIGDILADGTRKAAERIGQGSEEFAMHVKGLELGMHEPRLKRGLAISYAVNAVGGDHMATIHDPIFAQEGPNMEKARSIGIPAPLRIEDMGPAKVSAILKYHHWRMFGDAAILCHFVPWTFNQEIDIIRMLTGWDFGGAEALQVGERVATMGRAFNMREGLTAADDTLPKRFFSGTPRGALKESPLDPNELRMAVNTFYQMSGWDSETGLPTTEKLAELGLDWVEEQISSLRGVPA